MNKLVMEAIVFLLLVANFLTFHDVFEPHTVRDWLILFTSILIFFYLSNDYSKRLK